MEQAESDPHGRTSQAALGEGDVQGSPRRLPHRPRGVAGASRVAEGLEGGVDPHAAFARQAPTVEAVPDRIGNGTPLKTPLGEFA
jgi:hypothetical protein